MSKERAWSRQSAETNPCAMPPFITILTIFCCTFSMFFVRKMIIVRQKWIQLTGEKSIPVKMYIYIYLHNIAQGGLWLRKCEVYKRNCIKHYTITPTVFTLSKSSNIEREVHTVSKNTDITQGLLPGLCDIFWQWHSAHFKLSSAILCNYYEVIMVKGFSHFTYAQCECTLFWVQV